MAERSAIQWCDSTFNPWIGCTKVAPACDHCYAEADMDLRRHRVKWGAGQPRARTSEANWKLPVRWDRERFVQCPECNWRGAYKDWFVPNGEVSVLGGPLGNGGCPSCHCRSYLPARRRVFCASLADVFDNEVDPQWRADLFDLIARTPNLDWLLLTKRIGNAAQMMSDTGGFLEPSQASHIERPNVWIGATVTNQIEADRDIPKLLQVPAAVRFLSLEPLAGPVDLSEWLYPFKACENCPCPAPEVSREGLENCCRDPQLEDSRIHWIIAGGESGRHARPMSIQWVRELRDQCKDRTPFLFKQWGEWAPAGGRAPGSSGTFAFGDYEFNRTLFHLTNEYPRAFTSFGARCTLARVGKRIAGRRLDGVEHNGYPVPTDG